MKKFTKSACLFCSLMLSCSLISAQTQPDSVRIDLAKAIEIGLSESPTMRIADRDIKVKQEYRKEQIVALFPDVSLTGSYQRTVLMQQMSMNMNGQDMTMKVGKDNTYSAGASLSLPLVAPALWSSLKLTQMDIQLALESARSSKLELVSQVKQAFYSYLLAKQAYEVLSLSYNNQKINNELVNNQYNQGLASDFDKLRSDVALQNLLPEVTAARKNISLAEMNLKVILGLDLNEPVIFVGELSDYKDEVLNAQVPEISSLSLENNSSIKQLNLSIQELEQAKKITKSSSCPTLGLSANLMYNGMGNDKETFNNYPYSTIGLGLNVPIVSWAATSYKLKQADLNIANMEDTKYNTERNIRIGMQSCLNDMTNSVENLSSNLNAMHQAERAYSIAQKQYEIGMNTWLDLNTTSLQLTNTSLTLLQTLFEYMTAKAKLDALLGNE